MSNKQNKVNCFRLFLHAVRRSRFARRRIEIADGPNNLTADGLHSRAAVHMRGVRLRLRLVSRCRNIRWLLLGMESVQKR